MKTNLPLVLLTLLVALSGCAILPPGGDAGTANAPAPSENSAVVALLQNARQDATAGKFPSAAAHLERAIRIEPRNPLLWHELARVRLDEGQAQQAEQLAAKSNSLATNNMLRANNWRLIGHARAHNGDHAGAEAAFARAKELER
jgi:predicted Zn-dependent protease